MPTLLDCKSTKPTQWLNTVVAAFDWLQAGFLISSATGELLFANDAAGQILESKDGLALDENGRVMTGQTDSAPNGGCVGEFRAMLAAAQKRNAQRLNTLGHAPIGQTSPYADSAPFTS